MSPLCLNGSSQIRHNDSQWQIMWDRAIFCRLEMQSQFPNGKPKKKLAAQARFCVTGNVRWGINSSSIVGSRLISHCWESNKKKVYSDFKLQYKQTISILLRKGTPNTACVGAHWSMSSYSADLFVNAVLVVRAVRASQTQLSPFHCSDFTSIHLWISLVKWKLPDITHHLIFWATTCNIRVRQGRERKKN